MQQLLDTLSQVHLVHFRLKMSKSGSMYWISDRAIRPDPRWQDTMRLRKTNETIAPTAGAESSRRGRLEGK
jgi:hypothetical protein